MDIVTDYSYVAMERKYWEGSSRTPFHPLLMRVYKQQQSDREKESAFDVIIVAIPSQWAVV